MMLCHPEPVVAEPLDMAGKIGGVAQGLAGVASLDNGREVEDGERYHLTEVGPLAGISTHQSQPSARYQSAVSLRPCSVGIAGRHRSGGAARLGSMTQLRWEK